LTEELRAAALDYASKRVAVFPCGEDKAPLVRDGFKAASDDPAQVEAWWTEHPDALIGMPVPEGVVIIDMDPRNGGADSLRKLFTEHGRFPETRRARTRSGGVHYHFAFDAPEGTRFRRELAPGVDVKAAGKGYVIVPPSPGYTWSADVAPVPLPEWAAEIIVKPEAEEHAPSEAAAPKYFPFEEGTKYGLRAREQELAELLTTPEGGRNHALNKAAFSLAQLAAGGELDPSTTVERLYLAAERIGLDSEEADATIRSGWEAGEQDPRQAPEREPEPASVQTRTAVPTAESHFWTDWQVDEPAPPFYLDPVLPMNAYVLVYGATEAAKSMTWNAILADGSRNGVKSSVYSLENPRHVDRDRLRRLKPDPCCFRITHEPLDLGWAEDVEALIEREREWGTNVLFIDTYSHAFNSRQTEDGNARAIAFAQAVRYVMHELNEQGLSVVVVDHTGFPKEGSVKEPRDASAKRQQVDVAIYMEKDGEWTPGSNRAGFRMENFKAARFGNPFNIRGAILGRKGEALSLEWENADFASRWSA
jgi:hypothetical protein